ncbi:hypothetical protein [Mobilicoccus massiliensis]|uniref:hypothetical protein n=1 Tax=Mobilicoccus massiliensis TaxID=1522310 RepID=UPI00058F3212|nr:hypothetical protein [Mobilicoccus massiliensis]
MTDATGHGGSDDIDPADVARRAELLPEERAAGSDDPDDQAEVILEESEERTENEAVGIRDDNVASEPD